MERDAELNNNGLENPVVVASLETNHTHTSKEILLNPILFQAHIQEIDQGLSEFDKSKQLTPVARASKESTFESVASERGGQEESNTTRWGQGFEYPILSEGDSLGDKIDNGCFVEKGGGANTKPGQNKSQQFQVTQTHPKAKLPAWKRIAPTTQTMDTMENGMQHLGLKRNSGRLFKILWKGTRNKSWKRRL